jgi:hypothetical protein
MGKEEVTDKLASGTISRRGALKLLGGTALGVLVLPAFPSAASAAGKLQPVLETTSLGKFGGVKYVKYDGLFVGKTSTGNYRVPYRISAPANPGRANRRTVLVGPRLPFVELGEARFITGFLGTYQPQPPPTIEELGFSSFPEYLTAFEEALEAQVQARYMLKEDANAMLNRANVFPSETFTENYFRRFDEFRSGEYCP